MRNRIPMRAAAGAAALLLVVGAADAAKKAKDPPNRDPMQCLRMDLEVMPAADGLEAVLTVRWDCRKSELHADLAMERDGIPLPGAEARMEGARMAVLAAPLEGAMVEAAFELCGRVDGLAVQRKRAAEVRASECQTYDFGGPAGSGQAEP